MLADALRFARTIRHLQFSQCWYLIVRRLLPGKKWGRQAEPVCLRSGKTPKNSWVSTCEVEQIRFTFLNRTQSYPPDHIDWASVRMPKLWRYNLHYFDYLKDPALSVACKCHLITHWIAHNPLGTKDAWEPYTASLRIVNWIEFFQEHPDTVTGEWLESLSFQTLWLEGNIEYHILANHYLKNGVALFFAGVFLEGSSADRWLEKGRAILLEELDEQFLDDGGHYERSPMYHSICVADYLKVFVLMVACQGSGRGSELDFLRTRIALALDFLADICLPDGDIPLFNDSAFGIAPHPRTIFEHAEVAIAYRKAITSTKLITISKPHSGYYVLRNDTDMMVIDCGPVGPDYQPGHAHADTLSFELALNGRRVVVDTGVCDYETGSRRTYARSTKAHNTVCVDDQDQSEVWGVFRVARRAYPVYAGLTSDRPGHAVFRGAHDGYHRLPGSPIHERMIEFSSPGTWTVQDTLSGKGVHGIESYLHFHPDYEPHILGGVVEVRDRTGRIHMLVEPPANGKTVVRSGSYFPEFGKDITTSIIAMSYNGPIPVTLTYRMIKQS